MALKSQDSVIPPFLCVGTQSPMQKMLVSLVPTCLPSPTCGCILCSFNFSNWLSRLQF